MPVNVTCPGCNASYQLPDTVAGKKVRCKRCEQVFQVEAASGAAAKPSGMIRKLDTGIQSGKRTASGPVPPRPSRNDHDDEDVRPLRSRRRDEDDGEGSHHLPWIIGGVIGGVFVVGTAVIGVVLATRSSATPPPANPPAAVAINNAPPTRSVSPPPAALPPVSGKPAEPAEKGNGTIPLETMQAIKNASVYIKIHADRVEGSGSGFVISAQGDTALIVTNHHVVNPSFEIELPTGPQPRSPFRPPAPPRVRVVKAKNTQVTAVFNSGTPQEHSHAAEVLATDDEHDLAILKVTRAKDLPPPIDFMQDLKLVETMPVFSFGFPFGDSLAVNKANPAITVGKGTVSSIRLDDNGEQAFVQIDGASLNPGNSGCPVVDSRGRLVGVCVKGIRGGNNIALCIPACQLVQLVKGGIGSIEVKVVKSDPQNLEIEFSAQIIDLWQRIKGATLHYRTGAVVAGQTKDAFAGLPDTQKVELKLEQGKATGRLSLSLPAGRPAVDLAYLVALNDIEGKTMLTSVRPETLRSAPGTPAPPGTPTQVVANPAGGPPAGWKEYTAKNGLFVVWLPNRGGRQSEQTRNMTISGTRMQIMVLTYAPPGGPNYEAASLALQASVARKIPPAKLLDIFRDGYLEGSKGKILEEKNIQQGRLSGKEVSVQTPQGQTLMRIFVQSARVYMAAVAGTQEQTSAAEAKTFLDSFKLPDRAVVQTPDAGAPNAPKANLPNAGQQVTAQTMKAVLTALRGNNNAQVGQALDLLIATPPIPNQKKAVMTALEAFVNKPDPSNPFNRKKACKALAAWGGQDSVPTLAKLLNDSDVFVRHDVLGLLGDMKASKAAADVAQRLLVQHDSHKAAEALKAMGPDAEAEVVKYLTNLESNVRMNACRVLEAIGTQKSIPELQKALTDSNGGVKFAAQRAIEAIEQRK